MASDSTTRSDVSRRLAPSRITPPARTRPRLLPLRDPDFPWDRFEDLIESIARHVEGYVNVQRYGRTGQKQHGLDILASSAGLVKTVYQVRDIATLTAGGLRDAVEDYAAELRFRAERFVLCVACGGRDTKVQDELDRLRQKYAPLRIEVYDDARISDHLRDRPSIVDAFFVGWAEAFCVTTAPTRRLDADALLRGPVRALGLEADVQEAETFEADDPRRAASLFREIAARLEHDYPSQAQSFRERSATALQHAGARAEAFDAWFALAVDELWNRAEPRLSPSIQIGLNDTLDGLDGARRLRHQVLRAWEEWHENAGAAAMLASAFDGLEVIGDEFALRAGILFAEAHLVDGDRDPIVQRAAVMTALCSRLASRDEIRMQVALADALGASAWDPLYEAATKRELGLADAAYVTLRAGRFRAWAGDSERAELAYRRAVELAAEAALSLDAENALWSLVSLYAHYPQMHDRLVAANQTALAVEGTMSYIAQHPRTRMHALRAIADAVPKPDAHMWLRHELWEALAGGSLITELEALRDLGLLYQRSGDAADEPARSQLFDAALSSFVRAGEGRQARDLTKRSARWMDALSGARSATLWERRAALQAIEGEGDLVPDAVAAELVPLVIAELSAGSVDLAPLAAELAAAIARQLCLTDAQQIASAFAPLALREPGQYRLTDRGMLGFVRRAYELHSELRESLASILAGCAVGDGLDPDLARALDAAREDPSPFVRALVPQAEAGHAVAIVLLTHLGVDHALVRAREERRLANILALPVGEPRTQLALGADYAFGTSTLEALSPDVRHQYAQKLLRLATDDHDMVMNRASALEALAIASAVLTPDERAHLLTEVLELTGAVRVSTIEEHQRQANHPLSRMRFNLGGADEIRSSALVAAAALATTETECEKVAYAAFELSRDLPIAGSVARALYTLSTKGHAVDATSLYASSVPELRAAAAALWSAHGRPRQLGAALTRDDALGVRLELARGLRRLAAVDPVLASELRTRLGDDPSARVRATARRS